MRGFKYAFVIGAAGSALLAACSVRPDFIAKDEPWRDEEERACLAKMDFTRSAFLATRSSLGGPSVCGAVHPYDMNATITGRVKLVPAATLRCQMIPAVDEWVAQVVEPAARQYLHAELVELSVAGSYSCRPMNGVSGGKLSEHGHANAIDISSFHMADGHVVTVKGAWRGDPAESAFLHAVHDGSCKVFTTVLGPDANAYHRDHFHLDLARHGKTGGDHICE